MQRLRNLATALVGLIIAGGAMASCSATADVPAGELSEVVARDAVALQDDAIPPAVLSRLADNRVVLLGETHHLREHWAFVATLMSELNDAGFRQLLVERPQMNDWLIDDYVLGGELAPDWQPPPYFDRRFTAIRDLNATLPEEQRIHVRSIDANEDYAGGATDFQVLFDMLIGALPEETVVGVGLPPDYPAMSPDAQHEAIAALSATLEDNRSALSETWGAARYDQVVEMVEVEDVSIDIRQQRRDDDDGAARSREELVKELTDRRIAEYPDGTVINIGAHHAQKAHLMGTEQEWLGDYLAHESTTVDGSVYVIGFTSARTELESGAGGTPFSIVESASPENEVLRVLAETWPDQTVFLPLDDPLFADRTVAYNSEDVIYVTALEEQFDALIQYGLAHRMPID
jgi:hypothetical protein